MLWTSAAHPVVVPPLVTHPAPQHQHLLRQNGLKKKCSSELHLLTWPPLPWGPALYQIPDSKQCHHQTQSEEKKTFSFPSVFITAGNFWIVALGFILKIVFQVFVAPTISLNQSFEVWTADGCSEGQGWRDLKDSEPNSVGLMAFRKTNIINCCKSKQNKV